MDGNLHGILEYAKNPTPKHNVMVAQIFSFTVDAKYEISPIQKGRLNWRLSRFAMKPYCDCNYGLLTLGKVNRPTLFFLSGCCCSRGEDHVDQKLKYFHET